MIDELETLSIWSLGNFFVNDRQKTDANFLQSPCWNKKVSIHEKYCIKE